MASLGYAIGFMLCNAASENCEPVAVRAIRFATIDQALSLDLRRRTHGSHALVGEAALVVNSIDAVVRDR